MSRKLAIHPAALGDLADIADWYNQRDEMLRTSFLKAIDDTLGRLVQNPLQYQVVYRDFRRAPLIRFPQALFYLVSDAQITVVACIHGRRNLRNILQKR